MVKLTNGFLKAWHLRSTIPDLEKNPIPYLLPVPLNDLPSTVQVERVGLVHHWCLNVVSILSKNHPNIVDFETSTYVSNPFLVILVSLKVCRPFLRMNTSMIFHEAPKKWLKPHCSVQKTMVVNANAYNQVGSRLKFVTFPTHFCTKSMTSTKLGKVLIASSMFSQFKEQVKAYHHSEA